MTIEMNRDNVAEITSKKGIVLVDCWASWCRNCDEFAEAFRRSSEKNPGHVFATLDTQKQAELRAELGIQHIPSLLVLRDGVLLFKQPGSYDEAALDEILDQASNLDMDRVRSELAAQADAPAA